MELSLKVNIDITQDELDGYVLSGNFITPKTVRKLLGVNNNDWLVDNVTETLNAQIKNKRSDLLVTAGYVFNMLKEYPDSDGVRFGDKYESFEDFMGVAQQTLLLITLSEYNTVKYSHLYHTVATNVIDSLSSSTIVRIINGEYTPEVFK